MNQPAKAYREESTIADFIPYSYHVTDNIVSTTSGEYLTVWKVLGRTHDCASQEDVQIWHAELNNLIRAVASEKVGFWTHEHHYPVAMYPKAEYRSKFCQILDERYQTRFDKSPAMVTDLYLTVIYDPLADSAQKAFSKLEKSSPEEIFERQAEAIHQLNEINGQIGAALKGYGAHSLGIYFRDEKGNPVEEDEEENSETQALEKGFAYSRALEWLGYLVNGEASPVPVCRDRIREYLADSRVLFGLFGEMGEIRTVTRKRFVAAIEIRDYEEKTEPGQLNALKEAPYEYILTQSFRCMSPDAAKGFLTRQQRSMLEVGDASKSQVESLTAAMDAAVARRFVFGHHHATVHVYGNSPKQVRKDLDNAKQAFSLWGIKPGVCGLSSEAAYHAMLPANWKYRPRPCPINSWNFWCFSPFHNFMTGKPEGNPWGPAVTLFSSSTGSPFFFNWHPGTPGRDETGKRPAAHTMILGMTGEGKTTLLDFLLAQSEKFGARYVVYDKDCSTKPLILAMGGRYKRIRDGEASGWQPMQMEPNLRNIAFCKRLVTKLVKLAGEPVTHNDERQISDAVDAVMGEGSRVPLEGRTLTAVLSHLPAPHNFSKNSGASSVSSRLQPWCHGGQYGWLFDNPRDQIDLNVTSIYGYDLTEFLTDGDDEDAHPARSPLLMYLMYRNNQLVDGVHRHIEIFEEFWKYLDDPDVEKQLKDGLLTRRKYKSHYVFSTQEPEAALSSRITSTIRQQLATLILLPNPKADWESYKKLRLTRSEFDTMKDLPRGSRQFIVKQDDRAAIAKFDLGQDADDLLTVLSGTPESSAALDRIIAQRGPSPDDWLEEFMHEAQS